MKTLGFALLIVGLVALVVGGIEFNRQGTITEQQTIPVLPVVALLSLGGGVVLLLVSQKKRRA